MSWLFSVKSEISIAKPVIPWASSLLVKSVNYVNSNMPLVCKIEPQHVIPNNMTF